MNATQSQYAAAALAASDGGVPVAARLDGTGAFTARGPDSGSFLHGQLAADVAGLTAGRATRSLLLNHRGHAMAEAVVMRDAGEWLVVVEDGMAAWVGTTLAEHIVFDDVTLARLEPVATVTLQGAASGDVLAAVVPGVRALGGAEPGGSQHQAPFWRGLHTPSGHELAVYPRRRSAAGGYDLTLLGAQASAVDLLLSELAAAGAREVTSAAIDAARVAAAVTTAGRDGGAGVLPQEADLTAGLSYRKGCYLGQEVMARIEARGNLKRGLVTVEVVAAPAVAAEGRGQDEDPRAIELNGRSVGVLGTAAVMPDGRTLALAVLRRDLPHDAVLTASGLGLRIRRSPPL